MEESEVAKLLYSEKRNLATLDEANDYLSELKSAMSVMHLEGK